MAVGQLSLAFCFHTIFPKIAPFGQGLVLPARAAFMATSLPKVDDINWKLLNVRNDLTVIVLYTQDMREKAVQHILSEMLAEFEV